MPSSLPSLVSCCLPRFIAAQAGHWPSHRHGVCILGHEVPQQAPCLLYLHPGITWHRRFAGRPVRSRSTQSQSYRCDSPRLVLSFSQQRPVILLLLTTTAPPRILFR
ncbi:hypothetical protein BC567DRAFT_231574 [Phyllosticta citribraziliensis]